MSMFSHFGGADTNFRGTQRRMIDISIPKKTGPDYYLGLDLGQARDYTAAAIIDLENTKPEEPQVLRCRYLKRFPLGTPYPEIVEEVTRLVEDPRFKGQVSVAVDATGVGAPVVDLFLKSPIGNKITPIQITAGSESNQNGITWRVPKKDLVSTVQVLLQNGELQIAKSLEEAGTLIKELQNFRAKITAVGNEQFGAPDWREGSHDDLVLAVAMACWVVKKKLHSDSLIPIVCPG